MVENQQIGSAGNQHVADASPLHPCRFVKRRLTFLVINHVDDGVGRVGDEKSDNVFVAITAGIMKRC